MGSGSPSSSSTQILAGRNAERGTLRNASCQAGVRTPAESSSATRCSVVVIFAGLVLAGVNLLGGFLVDLAFPIVLVLAGLVLLLFAHPYPSPECRPSRCDRLTEAVTLVNRQE